MTSISGYRVDVGEAVTDRPRSFLTKVWQMPTGRIGLLLCILIIAATLFGPFIVTSSPMKLDLGNKLAPPDWEHLLGTDQFGRDQLARIIEGARRSLGAAALVLVGSLVISLVVGLTAGMLRGPVDVVLMRLVDVLLAFPDLVLALAIVGVLGPGFQNLLLALVISSWASNARIARSLVLAANARPDVLAARMAGVRLPTVVVGHILPGVLLQLLVVTTLQMGSMIVSLAGLSFLGMGAQPPAAEWGSMLSDSRLFFTTAPWLLAAPAVAIFLSVSAVTFLGDAIRDAADLRSLA